MATEGVPAGAMRIPGLMTGEELACLCRMARSAQSIVELGTYKGRSLAAMMLTNPGARAWAVDWFGDMSARGYKGSTEELTRGNLAKLGLHPELLVGTTVEVAPTFQEKVDLLHVDAGHSYEECTQDLKDWAPKVLPGGAVCVHDYGEPHNPKLRRPGVQKAVDDWRSDEWAEVERCGTMIAFRGMVAEEGALYVAYGDKARAGAKESIGSLKRVAPGLPVAVVSDSPLKGADYPIIHAAMDPGARAMKTRMYSLSPFRKTLYLDADTRVLASPEGGFRLLEWADLILAQDVNRRFAQAHWHALNPEERAATGQELVTEETMYWNSGVILFRRKDRLRAMMQAWHREWLRWKQQDQLALVRAIAQNPVRIVGMRAPWNTRLHQVAKFVLHMHHQVAQEGAPG